MMKVGDTGLDVDSSESQEESLKKAARSDRFEGLIGLDDDGKPFPLSDQAKARIAAAIEEEEGMTEKPLRKTIDGYQIIDPKDL